MLIIHTLEQIKYFIIYHYNVVQMTEIIFANIRFIL